MHASTHTRSAGPGTARFDDGLTGSLHPVSNDRVSSLRDSGHSIVPYTHAGGHHSGAPRALAPLGMDTSSARGPLDSMDPGRRSRSPQAAPHTARAQVAMARTTRRCSLAEAAHTARRRPRRRSSLCRRSNSSYRPSGVSVLRGTRTTMLAVRGLRTRRPMTTRA